MRCGAGRAEPIRDTADHFQVCLESRVEPPTQLGKGGAVGTGDSLFLLIRGGFRLLGDTVGWVGSDSLCHCGGVEGLNGGLEGVRLEGVVSEVWSDGKVEYGLEGVFNWAEIVATRSQRLGAGMKGGRVVLEIAGRTTLREDA